MEVVMKKTKKKDRWTADSLNKSNEIWNAIALALRGARLGSKPVSNKASGYHNYLIAEADYWSKTFGLDKVKESIINNQIVEHYQRAITNGLFDLRSYTMAGRIVPWFYLDLIGKRKKRKTNRYYKPIISFYPDWVLDAFIGQSSFPKLNEKLGEIRTEFESKFISNKRVVELGEQVYKLYNEEINEAKQKRQQEEENQNKQQGESQESKDEQSQDVDEDLDEPYDNSQQEGSGSEDQEDEQGQNNSDQHKEKEQEQDATEQPKEKEDSDSENESKEFDSYDNEDSFSNLMQTDLEESITDGMDFEEQDEVAELSSLVQGAKDLMQKFSAKEKVESDLKQGLNKKEVSITEKGKKTVPKCESVEDKELAKKLRKALVLRQKLKTNLDITGNLIDIQQYIKSKHEFSVRVFKLPQLEKGAKVIFSGDISGSMTSYFDLEKRIYAILSETFKGLIDFDQVWFTTGKHVIGSRCSVDIIRGDEIPHIGITPILYSTHFLLNQLKVEGYLKSIMIVFTDLGENCAINANKSFKDLIIKASRNRCQVIFAVPEDAYDDAYSNNIWYKQTNRIELNTFVDWFKFPVLKISIDKQDQLLRDLLALIRQFRLI